MDTGRISKQQPHCSQIQVYFSSTKCDYRNLSSHGNVYCHLSFHCACPHRQSFACLTRPVGTLRAAVWQTVCLAASGKKKSYVKQKSIHRFYSSLHDASSRTGAVWEVANSRKPLRLVCYPVWPNQTHSSSYPCSSRGTALLSSLNPVEVYSHRFQPPLCQGTYLCFTCALSLHSLKTPDVFPVYYSKTSVPALLICPKMRLIWRGFFFWNLFL